MAREAKFKPIVTRVKLNPEQAVLACSCYTGSYWQGKYTQGWHPQLVIDGSGSVCFTRNGKGFGSLSDGYLGTIRWTAKNDAGFS